MRVTLNLTDRYPIEVIRPHRSSHHYPSQQVADWFDTIWFRRNQPAHLRRYPDTESAEYYRSTLGAQRL